VVQKLNFNIFQYSSVVFISYLTLMTQTAYPMPTYTDLANKQASIPMYAQSSYGNLEMGCQLVDKGQYQQALLYIQQSIEQNPSSVIAEYNLGYILMQMGADNPSEEQKQQKLSEAEWAFLRVRDLNPDLSLTYYKLGKLALMREDFKTAQAYYQSGIESHPDNFALLFNLAATDEKLNDLPSAEKAYLKVIDLNPKFVYAYNNLGLIYEQTNHPDKAEAMYRQALTEVPEYNYARLNLGSMLQGQGRLDEAMTMYKEAIQVEPNNAFAHLYLGNAYYRKGDYQNALNAYQEAISLDPKYPTTYYLMSLALEKLNRSDEALAKGLQYINLAPSGAFSEEAGELVLTLQQAKKDTDATNKP
jgi:tetratricopeptide (TPR) repeat protein